MKGKIACCIFVSIVCKPKKIKESIIKKPVVVDVAQLWVNHVKHYVFLFYVVNILFMQVRVDLFLT
jgi:hypothetical protein